MHELVGRLSNTTTEGKKMSRTPTPLKAEIVVIPILLDVGMYLAWQFLKHLRDDPGLSASLVRRCSPSSKA